MPAAIWKILLEFEHAINRESLWLLRFQRLNAGMIYQSARMQQSFSPDFMRGFHSLTDRNPPSMPIWRVRPKPQAVVAASGGLLPPQPIVLGRAADPQV